MSGGYFHLKGALPPITEPPVAAEISKPDYTAHICINLNMKWFPKDIGWLC
jgi:hypothetical protein